MPMISVDSPSAQAQSFSGAGSYNDPMMQQLSTLQGLYGPQLAAQQAGYQQQVDALQNQVALYGQQTPYQQSLVTQGLQNQMAQYGLQGTGLGEQNVYNQAQQRIAGQELGIQQQQLGLQGQQLGAQQNYQNQQFWNTLGNINLQRGGIEQAYAEAQANYTNQLNSLTQGSAAAGVGNTGTQRQGEQRLYQQLGFAGETEQRGLAGADIAQQQAIQGAQYQGVQNQIARQQLGLQGQQLGLQGQQQFAGDVLQNQQYQNALKGLGLNEQQAQQKAQQAIAQLGLQGQVSVDQVLAQIGQLNAGQATQLSGVLPQIMSLMTG